MAKKTKNSVEDIVELDITNDGDICDEEELNSLYQQPYFCSARKSVGLEKLYILHVDCHWKSNRLAAALSNNSIHLTSTDTLEKISTFIAHDQSIIDVHFNPVDPNILFSASSDGTIRVWDIRNTQGCTQQFKDDSDKRIKPFSSFDVNCDGTLLCGGTEKVNSDTYLIVWDTRSPKIFTSYSDFHEDDISHVQFHHASPKMLASCSTDCLINVYDFNETDEDNVLQFCMNTETTCERLQWLNFNKTIKQESISVITNTESVQIWDIEEASPRYSFTREQVSEALKRKNAETCFAIRCFQRGEEKDPLLLAGSSTPNRGCLRMMTMRQGKLEPYAILYDNKGGNSQIIRGAVFNQANGQIVSGGEDGIINVWMPGEDKPVTSGSSRKIKTEFSTKKAVSPNKKPYSK